MQTDPAIKKSLVPPVFECILWQTQWLWGKNKFSTGNPYERFQFHTSWL